MGCHAYTNMKWFISNPYCSYNRTLETYEVIVPSQWGALKSFRILFCSNTANLKDHNAVLWVGLICPKFKTKHLFYFINVLFHPKGQTLFFLLKNNWVNWKYNILFATSATRYSCFANWVFGNWRWGWEDRLHSSWWFTGWHVSLKIKFRPWFFLGGGIARESERENKISMNSHIGPNGKWLIFADYLFISVRCSPQQSIYHCSYWRCSLPWQLHQSDTNG